MPEDKVVNELKANGDIEGLIEALGQNEDKDVRSSAAVALGKIGDTRAVEPLIAALGDQNEVVRRGGAMALGKISDRWQIPPAVEPLIVALGDEDKWVRRWAAVALGEIGDTRAVEPLIVALGDEDRVTGDGIGDVKDVRHYAADALDRLGWSPEPGAAGAANRALMKAARPSKFGWLASVVLAAMVGVVAVALALLILRNVLDGWWYYAGLFWLVVQGSYSMLRRRARLKRALK